MSYCLKDKRTTGHWIRRFILLCLAVQVSIGLYVWRDPLSNFKYFTQWGKWFTFITFAIGSFVCDKEVEQFEHQTYQDDNFVKRKYRCCRPWKLFTFLYESTLIMEIIVTSFYWTVLYEGNCRDKIDNSMTGDFNFACFCAVTDHTFPMFALLVDYTYNA